MNFLAGSMPGASLNLLFLVLILIATAGQAYLLPAVASAADKSNSAVDFSLQLQQHAQVDEAPERATERKVAEVRELSPERAVQLFSSLKPIPRLEEHEFRFPENSLPRPELGKGKSPETVAHLLPANRKYDRASARGGAVDRSLVAEPHFFVTRVSHSGNYDEVKEVSISFSKPMIQIGQLQTVEASRFVSLDPQPPGAWRWAGTRTLVFTPAGGRLPKSTDFKFTVAESARASDGTRLKAPYSWHVRTATTRLEGFLPCDFSMASQCTRPALLAYFNQSIEPSAVLSKIELSVGAQIYPLRFLSNTELESRNLLKKELRDKLSAENWLVFEPTEPLPKGSRVEVRFADKLPSAEGPLVGASADTRSFRVFGPLEIVQVKPAEVGGGDIESGSLKSAVVQFSNPLNSSNFRSDMITVSPTVGCLSSQIRGETIEVYGRFRPSTKYKMELSKAIQDRFGQSLSGEKFCFFESGSLKPLIKQGPEVRTLKPGGALKHSIWVQGSRTARVTVSEVKLEDWLSLLNRESAEPWPDRCKQLATVSYPVPSPGRNIQLDLAQWFKSKCGHLLVKVELVEPGESKPRAVSVVWIQVTDIFLHYFIGGKTVVTANSYKDGKPLEGVDLSFSLSPARGRTDANGVATLAVTPPKAARGVDTLLARKGQDTSLLRFLHFVRPLSESVEIFAVCDRKVYRPGETACIKGWVRGVRAEAAGLKLYIPEVKSLQYVFQAGLRHIAGGTVAVDSAGGFSFEVVLPVDAPLGLAQLILVPQPAVDTDSWQTPGTVSVNIQEFRKPEFELTLLSSKAEMMLGEETSLKTSVNYLSGGAVRHAINTLEVRGEPANFQPDGWLGYTFNKRLLPWSGDFKNARQRQTLVAETDAQGQCSARLKLNRAWTGMPTRLDCESTISGLTNQTWSERLSVLVHPAKIYVGLKDNTKNRKPGQPLKIALIATDTGGKVLPGRTVNLRITERFSASASKVTEEALSTKAMPVEFRYFPARMAELVMVQARVLDDEGRESCSEISVEVPRSPNTDIYRSQLVDPDFVSRLSVNLSSDKVSYQPGDIAQVKILSPFVGARGWLSVGSAVTPLQLEGAQTTVKIPITEANYPGFPVRVFLMSTKQAVAAGRLTITVPPSRKSLTVTVQPVEEIVAPGGEATVQLLIKDAAGNPVAGAHAALAVVDEAVLKLSKHKWPNPLGRFYEAKPVYFMQQHTGLLERGLLLEVANSRIVSGRIAEANDPADSLALTETPESLLRKNMTALAVFKPDIETDAGGKARVSFKMPDNVTRYRILALAAAGADRFGAGQSFLSSRLALAIKPSPPRFLSVGDNFELPVVLQNQTEQELRTELAVRTENLELESPGKVVVLPAGEAVCLSFKGRTKASGEARVQLIARAGQFSDATQFSVPVYIPAISKTVAACGVLDQVAILEKVVVPGNVFPKQGGLTVSLSSSAADSLNPACKYLREYRYDCSEQVSSRLIGMLSMRQSLIEGGSLAGAELVSFDKQIQGDVDLLQKRQNGTGGFRLWSSSESSAWPFVSIQAVRALAQARESNFRVSDSAIELAIEHLKSLSVDACEAYSEDLRLAVRAYALNVLHSFGKDDSKAIDKAVRDIFSGQTCISDNGQDGCSTETLAWLLPVVAGSSDFQKEAAIIRRVITGRIVETTSTASVSGAAYSSGYQIFASPGRADAVVLEALIDDQPGNELIVKLANGLLKRRNGGLWNGTQENSTIVRALQKYFRAYEKQVPDSLVRAWYGENMVLSSKFSGRKSQTSVINVPMSYVQAVRDSEVFLSKTGPGRLYYGLSLEYFPCARKTRPEAQGISISRTYEPVDCADDVSQDRLGTWHIKAGALVRVRLHFNTIGSRYHVALVDPLPAGVEPVNYQLLGNRSLSSESKELSADKGIIGADDPAANRDEVVCSFEHSNLRDNQAESFLSVLEPGQYQHCYYVRATNRGTFNAAPGKIEEMYSPETFGQTQSDVVCVE